MMLKEKVIAIDLDERVRCKKSMKDPLEKNNNLTVGIVKQKFGYLTATSTALCEPANKY
jgi:hypothetical protein